MSNLVNEILGDRSSVTSYRSFGSRSKDTTLGCGYMRKSPEQSDIDICLNYYGGTLLLAGEGVYTDGTCKHRITPGTFIQRLPGHMHSTIVTPGEEWVEFFICINTSTYRNLVDMGLMSTSPVLKGKVPEKITASFPEFLRKMQSAAKPDLLPLFFEAQSLLCEISLLCTEENINGSMVKESIRLLDYTFGRISGEEIAAQIGVSYETLRKNFHKAMGISLGKYAILSRISLAKEELLSSNLTLAQVSEKLGYTDYFTFCKQFKQYADVTPKVFRETNGLLHNS